MKDRAKNINCTLILANTMVLAMTGLGQGQVQDATLQGNVRTDATNTRLSRPASSNAQPYTLNASQTAIPVAPPRLKASAQSNGFTGLVDTAQFASMPPQQAQPPLSGNVNATANRNKFDIGAEANSRVLTLAWEAWHKQLSKEIYSRWQDVAFIRGRASMRVTVTKDRHVIAQILEPSGNARYDQALLDVVHSLEGNPGLTFPSGSQRQQVSFDADYIADSNVRGGYSWNKGDYEQVQQNY